MSWSVFLVLLKNAKNVIVVIVWNSPRRVCLPVENRRDRDYNIIDIGCHKILYKRVYELTVEINKIGRL